MFIVKGEIDLTTAEAVVSLPTTSLTTGRLISMSSVYYYYAGGWIPIAVDAGTSDPSGIQEETIIGNINATGSISCNGGGVIGQNLQVDGQTWSTLKAIGSSGATKTVNWNDANVQTLTLTAGCTLTFSNPKSGGVYRLIVTQDSTPRAITWPASVKWVGGAAPTLTATNAGIDMITFVYNGTNYLGVYDQAFA